MKTIITLGICALTISLLFSCKKMPEEKNAPAAALQFPASKKVVAAVTEWMNAQPANAKLFTAMVNGKMIKQEKEFNWNETEYFPQSKIAITPVSVKNMKNAPKFKYLASKFKDDGTVEAGFYFDVLGKQPNQLSVKDNLPDLVQNKKAPAAFKGAIVKYDMYDRIETTDHYENGRVTGKNGKLILKKGIKVTPGGSADMPNAPLDEGCQYVTVDWYWQTYVNGVLVYEEYLFSSEVIVCEEGGGGGGGGGGNPYEACNAQFNALVNGGVTTSSLSSILINYNQPAERQYTYKWKALQGIGFKVNSFDIGTHTKTNDPKMPWKWKSIVHNAIQIEGTGIGGLVDKVGEGTLSVTLGFINANVSLDFTIKYTPNCGIPGAPSLNPFYVSYHSQIIFSINPYPGGPQPTLQ